MAMVMAVAIGKIRAPWRLVSATFTADAEATGPSFDMDKHFVLFGQGGATPIVCFFQRGQGRAGS